MILHFNHVSGGTSSKSLGDLTGLVVGSIVSLVEQGAVDARLLPSLRVHLDWIHYKHNFRDRSPCGGRPTPTAGRLALAEIAIDLRQADPALMRAGAGAARCRRSDPGARVRAGRSRPPGRLRAAAREHHLAVQPSVLAAARRLGGGVGHADSKRRCRAASRMRIIRRRSPIRSPTSGRCCAIWTPAASCRRKSSRSRSASARARAPRRGWIGFKALDEAVRHRVLPAAAASCWATTPPATLDARAGGGRRRTRRS